MLGNKEKKSKVGEFPTSLLVIGADEKKMKRRAQAHGTDVTVPCCVHAKARGPSVP